MPNKVANIFITFYNYFITFSNLIWGDLLTDIRSEVSAAIAIWNQHINFCLKPPTKLSKKRWGAGAWQDFNF